MKTLLHHLVTALFFIQSAVPSAYAVTKGEEQICDNCVDKNSKPGTKVEHDGRIWELVGIETFQGEPMWRVKETDGWGEGSGGSSFDKEDRITHRDFGSFEDNSRYSERERNELRKVQQKILNRLNEETRVDTEATNKELAPQYAGLVQAVQDAGTVAYRGADLSIGTMDPVQALHDSLKTQTGNDSLYIDQTGWQPFDDREYQSSHKSELEGLRDRLNYSVARTPQQADAKRAGIIVLSEADKAYVTQDLGLGNSLVEAAKILVDIATDVIPLTAIPKDFYRTFVGKDPMTGENLANWERALACGFFIAGMATLGGTNIAKSWIKAVAKVAKLSPEVAVNGVRVATLEKEKAPRSVVAKIKDSLSDVKLLNPARENKILMQTRGYTELAWNERKIILSGKTKEPMTLVRFMSSTGDKVGSWLTPLEQVMGKTPEQIKLLLGLPETPTHFTIAKIPRNENVIVGFVSPNNWGGDQNALQYFFPRPLMEYFREVHTLEKKFKGLK